MKRNDILELTIQSYAYEGKGVAKIPVEKDGVTKDFVVFVQHAYPGDVVKAEIRKIKIVCRSKSCRSAFSIGRTDKSPL